jgi:hypothetical protein
MRLPPSSVLSFQQDFYTSKQENAINKQTPWSQATSELYRPSEPRLLAKLVPTFEDRKCHVSALRIHTAVFLDF